MCYDNINECVLKIEINNNWSCMNWWLETNETIAQWLPQFSGIISVLSGDA